MRNTVVTLLTSLILSGCGVELLTTTAIEGELQRRNIEAIRGQVAHAADSTARINLQRAITTYQAEKGQFPKSLEVLVPDYLPSIPTQGNGTPFNYNPATGQLLDAPTAPQPQQSPTKNDLQKMTQITNAINQYGMAVGYYPPSLQALIPTYLPTLPKTDSGEDFLFDPQTGLLSHPSQTQNTTTPPSPTTSSTTASAPTTEAITGMGIQGQLNNMNGGATNAATSYGQRQVDNISAGHTQQQEKAMNDLGL